MTAPTDKFNVTASFDKTTYTIGDPITVTITGDDVQTTILTGQVGPLTLHLTAADGATVDVTVPAVPVSGSVATHQSVKITGVTDTSATPRQWTVGANGLTATAKA